MQEIITIREAYQKDAEAIATILYELGLFEHVNNELPAVTEHKIALRLLQGYHDRCNTVLVAEQGNEQTVGYIAAHWFPNLMRGSVDGYVSELFVSPRAAGHGVGSLLLDAIHERAVKRGCTRLLLMNRRDRESYKRGFYSKHGWQEMPEAAYFIYHVDE